MAFFLMSELLEESDDSDDSDSLDESESSDSSESLTTFSLLSLSLESLEISAIVLFLNAPVLGYDTTLIAGLIATVLGYAAGVGFIITFEAEG